MRSAFTLIELLVVIAIVVTIIAVFMPLVSKARELGRKAQCANNMRQIGIALHMYCDDHDDLIPIYLATNGLGSADEWWIELAPYLDITCDPFDAEIYRCLTAKNTSISQFIPNAYAMLAPLKRTGNKGLAYNINFLLVPFKAGKPVPKRLSQATHPATTLCLYDCVNDKVGVIGKWFFYNASTVATFVSDRHTGGTNILWLDGHVGWKRKKTVIDKAKWWKPYDNAGAAPSTFIPGVSPQF